MRILLIILLICVAFGGYKWYQNHRTEDDIVSILEESNGHPTPEQRKILNNYANKVLDDAAERNKQRQPQGQPAVANNLPPAVLPVYNADICNRERTSCNQFFAMEKNPPANARLDQSFYATVNWCKKIIAECVAHGF